MISKMKINLILSLCLISLISIGFSSWFISEDGSLPHFTEGSFETDTVIYSKEYIYLDNSKGDLDSNNIPTGIKCFKYSEDGYLDENDIPISEGYVNAYFVIDINKCKSIFFNNNVNVNLILKYANNNNTQLNIFKNYSDSNGYQTLFNSEIIINNNIISEPNLEINMGSYSVIKGEASGIDNFQYCLPIGFKNILNVEEDYIYFIVKYSFFATTGDYFRENIYKYMYSDMIEFSLEISISDRN